MFCRSMVIGVVLLGGVHAVASASEEPPLPPSGERSLEDWVAVLVSPEPKLSPQATVIHQLKADKDYRGEVEEARDRIETAGAAAVPALSGALTATTDARAIGVLSEMLGWVGREAAAAVPLLEDRLAQTPAPARYSVAAALGRIDPRPDSPALPYLEHCLSDPAGESVRLHCLFALEAIGGGAGLQALIAALEDEDDGIRQWAIMALSTAPDESVRAPLEARLADAVVDVRVTAAARLVAVEPATLATSASTTSAAASPTSEKAFEMLARDLCNVRVATARMALRLLDGPRELPASAVNALAEGLRSTAPLCRQATAVLLAKLDPFRAWGVQAAMTALGDAARGGNDFLRWQGVSALAGLGCGASSQLAALEAAAADSPIYEPELRDVRNAQSHCPLEESSLVATVDEPSGGLAAIFERQRAVQPVWVGDAFLDATVERIEPGVVVLRQWHVETDLSVVGETRRLELFTRNRPGPVPAASTPPANDQALIDIDFEGDLVPLVEFLARIDAINVILEPAVTGPVRLVARRVPREGLLRATLLASGFSWRTLGSFAVVGAGGAGGKGGERTLERQFNGEPATAPVSFSLSRAALSDVFGALEKVLDLEIVVPPGDHAPVTLFADQRPALEIIEALVVSRGWRYRLDANGIVITAPSG